MPKVAPEEPVDIPVDQDNVFGGNSKDLDREDRKGKAQDPSQRKDEKPPGEEKKHIALVMILMLAL